MHLLSLRATFESSLICPCHVRRLTALCACCRALAAVCRHVAVNVVEAADGSAAALRFRQGAAVEADGGEVGTPQPEACARSTANGNDGCSGGAGGSAAAGWSHATYSAASHVSSAAGRAGQVQLQHCSSEVEDSAVTSNGYADMHYQQVLNWAANISKNIVACAQA